MTRLLIVLTILFNTGLQAQNCKDLLSQYKSRDAAGDQLGAYRAGLNLLNACPTFTKKPSADLASVNNSIGNYYFSNDRYTDAANHFKAAANVARLAMGDTSFDYALYLVNFAVASGRAGLFSESENAYSTALPLLAQSLGAGSPEYTMFYKEYVEMKIEQGDYANAKPMNDALVYYYKTMYGEQNEQYLICMNNAARIFQYTGNYQQASMIFSDIISAYQNLPKVDSSNFATLLNNSGECFRLSADYPTAKHYLSWSLAILRRLPKQDLLSEASVLNNLGLTLKAMGDFPSAERSYLNSISAYEKAGFSLSTEVANPCNNIGELYRLMGNYPASSDYLNRALRLKEKAYGDNHEYYANTLVNFGLLFMDVDKFDDAEQFFEKAIEVYERRLGTRHPYYANAINNLASLYARTGKIDQAEELKKKALDQIEKELGPTSDKYALFLSGLAAIHNLQKKHKLAAEEFLKSGEILKNNFGEGNWDYLEMVLSASRCFEQNGQLDLARNYLLQGMNSYSDLLRKNFITMNDMERLYFYDLLSGRFNSFNLFTLEHGTKTRGGKPDEELITRMFELRLLTKSLLANETNRFNKYIGQSQDTTLIRRYKTWLDYRKLYNQMVRYTEEERKSIGFDMDALESLLSSSEKELQYSMKTFDVKDPGRIPGFADVIKKLAPQEAIVEIVKIFLEQKDSVPQVAYAALICKKGLKAPLLVELKGGTKIDKEWIDEFRDRIIDKQPDTISYSRFWKPIAKHLTDVKRVYYSPDGAYHKLNPYALFDPSKKKYVIDEHEIVCLSSPRDMLDTLHSKTQFKIADLYGYPDYYFDFSKEQTALAMNNPRGNKTRFGFSELPPLPGTLEEINSIGDVFIKSGWMVNKYQGKFASEHNIKKTNRPAILHVATHGYFLPEVDFDDDKLLGIETKRAKYNPLLRSGVILAGAGITAADSAFRNSDEDGILTAQEAADLNLFGTELVVLSACETGLGEVLSGEGIYGLQRAFYTAGASATLMSLWIVDDEATKELMKSFYNCWISGLSPNKPEALRQTLLQIRKKFPHPYFWSAFVLTGK